MSYAFPIAIELKENLKRASEYAAGNPRIKAIIVAIGAIIKLLVIEEYNSGLRSSPFQLANVGECWSSGMNWKIKHCHVNKCIPRI